MTAAMACINNSIVGLRCVFSLLYYILLLNILGYNPNKIAIQCSNRVTLYYRARVDERRKKTKLVSKKVWAKHITMNTHIIICTIFHFFSHCCALCTVQCQCCFESKKLWKIRPRMPNGRRKKHVRLTIFCVVSSLQDAYSVTTYNPTM